MTGATLPNAIGHLPPRTQGLPLVGALPALLRRPFPFFLAARERYGDIYSLDLGMTRMTVLNHPSHAQHILAERSANYGKGGALWESVRTLLGNGLAVSEGAFWLRQRRMMQPHFHRHRLAGLTSLMVEAIDASLQGWEAPAAARTPFNLSPAFASVTMQVIVKALFGQGLAQAQVEAVGAEMAFVVDYLLWGVLTQSLPRRLPLPGARRYQQALHTIDAVVALVIDQQRRAPESADHLLAMLLQMVDAETGEQMTDAQLRDEVVTFFLAGYETTSLTLSWALHFLTQHPETMARLVAEVDSVLAGRTPTFADIPSLVYTRMVVQEALRMRPPAWHLTRTAIEADTIDGFNIPAGHSKPAARPRAQRRAALRHGWLSRAGLHF